MTTSHLTRARHNLRRDHIRHRLTNLARRIERLGDTVTTLSDRDCDRLERLITRLEGEMPA